MSQGQPIRSLAAIVFTDIVGYSALVNRDDANAMRLVKEHFALVREIAARFGGKVIKTIGDSVHLEFASAQAATACAIAVQQAHRQRNARVAKEQQFEIRIGLHLGDVEHRDGDIYGDGVNIAARLQPLAPVGGIAISDHVRGQLRLDLRNRFTSRGAPTLKNIETPIELFVLEGEALADVEADASSATEERPASRSWRSRRTLVAVAIALALLTVAGVLAPHLRSKNPAGSESKSIAVLPFVDMSPAKDQEYFSDGIAEDLLNLLSKIETLQVAARTSSFSFKGQNLEVTEIARRLRVANVLEGSVRKAGDQVRINARLVRAADGFEIWSQTWDRTLDDIFKVQDEIAGAVVSQLKVKLLGAEPTAKAIDPKVYPLILQAEAFANQGSTEGDTQAIAVYEQALALAPNEARAWAGMGRAYFNRGLTGTNTAEDIGHAKQAANRALDLDARNAMAMAQLGRIAADFDLDLPTAARYYQEALEAEPGNLKVINAAATTLLYIGRVEDARPLYEYRIAHDAANPTAYANLGNCLMSLKQWDAAIDAYRMALRLSPGYGQLRASIGGALMMGKHDAAGALKEFEAEGDEVVRMSTRPIALHALGRKAEAEAALQAFIDRFGNDHATFVAAIFAYRGRGGADQAFEWLEKAVAGREPYLAQVLSDPAFAPLADDPRWLPFLRKIGYAPEQLAKIELTVTLPASASAGE